MLTIWTDKERRTREGLIAKVGETIQGRSYKKDDESFRGGIIFGNLPTSLVYSLNAERLFEVEPIGEKTRILGGLWKTLKARIVKELDAPVYLSYLIHHRDFWARKAVAETIQDPKILQKLAQDENGWVLAAVAANPYTNEETCQKLCYCTDPLVRAIAIRRSPLALGVLEDMDAKETDVIVRMALEKKLKPYKYTPFFTRVKLSLLGY